MIKAMVKWLLRKLGLFDSAVAIWNGVMGYSLPGDGGAVPVRTVEKTALISVSGASQRDAEYVDAEVLARRALTEAYGATIPPGAIEFLKMANKPGTVLALFYSGRSGSMLLQSFFDKHPYPRILAAPPEALIGLENNQYPQADMDLFGDLVRQGERAKVTKAVVDLGAAILARCPGMFTDAEGAAKDAKGNKAPRRLFADLVQAQIAWLAPGELTYDALLKILFVAHRLARGEPIDCSEPGKMIYMWQAHAPLWHRETQWPHTMPYLPRRQWLRQAFPGMKSLTVVRFPEKSFDSHLIHHGFESVQPPLGTLFRRMLFDAGMAWSNEISGGSADGTECAVRFEDVHHHSEFVIRRICAWAGMDFDPSMTASDFALSVRGKAVSGVRRLTVAEMQPKLLPYFDILKLRVLLQENYRAWGYESFCTPSLEDSIHEYEDLSKSLPFASQALLAELGQNPVLAKQESTALRQMFEKERQRREQGITLIPLLYDVTELPALA